MRTRISVIVTAIFLTLVLPVQLPIAQAAVASNVGIAQSNLLMYYDLANPSGISGTSLTDLAGNFSTGSLIQTSSKPSLSTTNGNYLDFTGNGGYVDLPDIVSASNWTGLSVSFYANMGTRTLVERIFDFGNGAANNNIWVGMGDGNNMAIEVWRDSASPGWCRSATGSVVANEWAQWTVVLDGTNCKWYKNNTLSLSTAYSYLPWAKTLTLNYIGKSNWNDPFFEGGIGELAIYKSALSDAERLQNFNAQSDLTKPTLSTINLSVAENRIVVDTLTASEASTFVITSGSDSSKFSMSSGGTVSFTSAPNFEVATDSNGDNVYLLEIRVTDANGNYSALTIYVTVTNLAEVASLTVPVLDGTPYKGMPVTITVTPSAGSTAGKVNFLIAGKRIPNCYKKSFSGAGNTTCTFKPAVTGNRAITVTFTPNGSEYTAVTVAKSFFIEKRTTTR
jgi:hypothetical protein